MDGAAETMSAAQRLRSALSLDDPFAGFAPDPSRVDLQGWNSSHPFFAAVLDAVQPSTIIELGVWKGMSVIHMAALSKAAGRDVGILAIDTWLGASAHIVKPERRGELKMKAGYPTLYETFANNVFAKGHDDVVVPLALDGMSAASGLRRIDFKADVIHIDASHEYAAALADMRAYWPLLADDGVMICDDYATWIGVTRAVNEFAAEVDRPLFGSIGKAILPKRPDILFEMQVARAKPHRRDLGSDI